MPFLGVWVVLTFVLVQLAGTGGAGEGLEVIEKGGDVGQWRFKRRDSFTNTSRRARVGVGLRDMSGGG